MGELEPRLALRVPQPVTFEVKSGIAPGGQGPSPLGVVEGHGTHAPSHSGQRTEHACCGQNLMGVGAVG